VALLIIVGVADVLVRTGVFPKVTGDLRTSLFENLITLDGVLFGFSIVMLGLFFPNLQKMSDGTVFCCMVFIMVSFFGYIISIGASFVGIGSGSSASFMNPYFDLVLTLSSLVFSSIYILMILIDEYYPSEKSK
jgi:glucan phosphoethanolaminetransferase (alkaline phosphatase superfamily)